MMMLNEHERESTQAVIEPGITPVHRASPPHAPRASAALESARAEHDAYTQDRERTEHAGLLRALLVLAAVVLVGSIWRAGLDRVFVHGWWGQW